MVVVPLSGLSLESSVQVGTMVDVVLPETTISATVKSADPVL